VLHSGRTRDKRHELKLDMKMLPLSPTEPRQGLRQWSTLPGEAVQSPSLQVFNMGKALANLL